MPAKKKSPPQKSTPLFVAEKIAPLVHVLRHEKVLLDSDLAELYGVSTGRLNEAVKRNLDRFPDDFMFQLTEDEMEILISQIATSKNAETSLRSQSVTLKPHGGRRHLPYAFTKPLGSDQKRATQIQTIQIRESHKIDILWDDATKSTWPKE